MSTPPYQSANVERFSGFAARYNSYRPQPPLVVVELLTQLAGSAPPHLVVDLGSGTGLSTRLWAEHAAAVTGIEPNDDMRREAEQASSAMGNVRYHAGLSSQTNLPDHCADIVTCSQALHWMEPTATFAEVGRILRPDGLFAAYDCDWPPTMNWEAEQAFDQCRMRAEQALATHGLAPDIVHWDKQQHIARMRASEQFRFVKEVVVHHIERGNAERLVGLVMSQGSIATLLKHGVAPHEFGLDTLQAVATRTLGAEMALWYWSYRVRIGIK